MKIEASGKLSQKIAVLAEKLWPRYLCHPFITQMADGTLPLEKFRYYMLQDYLYLRDYTKILAAILQKADTFEQIRFLSGEIESTLGETYRTHIPYMQRLGITEEEICQAHTHIDNCAYSHYMLCETQNGNVLTGLVALLNCSWSYAYIAEQMVQRYPQALQNKTYGAWFAGYLSEEYRKANQDLIDRIDALAASAPQPHAYKHTTRYGDADVSLDWLCSQPQTSAVLHRAQPSQLLLRPLLVVVSQIGVEHAAELEYRHARPVPMVEELEAPMYVNSLFSPEISARHRILPGTERSSGGRSQRSLPFGIRR